MNIIVCIKQTPDTEKVKFNPETRTLLREGVENIMNPFDMQALARLPVFLWACLRLPMC